MVIDVKVERLLVFVLAIFGRWIYQHRIMTPEYYELLAAPRVYCSVMLSLLAHRVSLQLRIRPLVVKHESP